MTGAPIASTDDSFAWDVIAQVSALLAPVAEAMGDAAMAAFELVEDALAQRASQEGRGE